MVKIKHKKVTGRPVALTDWEDDHFVTGTPGTVLAFADDGSLTEIPVPDGVDLSNYPTYPQVEEVVDQAIAQIPIPEPVDLSNYATIPEVNAALDDVAAAIPDVSHLATIEEVAAVAAQIPAPVDLTVYYTKAEVDAAIAAAIGSGPPTNNVPAYITPNGAIITPELYYDPAVANPRETYPPPLKINIPPDVEQSTDFLVWEARPLGGGTITRTIVALSSGSGGSYPVGLSAIVAPAKTEFRAGIQGPAGSGRASYPTAWLSHGDATAPVITTSASLTFAENGIRTLTIETSEPTTIVLSGETATLTRTTSATERLTRHTFTLTPDYELDNSINFTATVTDLAGLTSSKAFTLTITNDPSDDPTTSVWQVPSTGFTPSNGDRTLTTTSSGGGFHAYGTKSHSTGKRWLAFDFMRVSGSEFEIGLMDTTTGVSMRLKNNGQNTGGTGNFTTTLSSGVATNVRVELDFDSQVAEFFKNGASVGKYALPANMPNPQPALYVNVGLNSYATINTGQEPVTATAGFSPWG